MKIVSDSSSNLHALAGANFASVPMKVIAGEKEYIDDQALDVAGMVADLKAHKGKSGSSCPNVQDWLDAFGGEQEVFAVTISKNLSGSYNSAKNAADDHMEEHPGAKVHVFDSLSAGPEMAMLVDKLKALMDQGLDFDTIKEKVSDYHNHLHTLFSLESMQNLARNGRVNPAVAKLAGLLGIRAVGDAKGGQLSVAHKPRGEKKALQTLVQMMEERGFSNSSLVRIAHCFTEHQALSLKALVLEKFPGCRVIIEPTAALCSFYAEAGGLMVGFEGSFNHTNSNLEF